MDFVKKGLDGQVDQVIDKAADFAKQKAGELMGGGAKQEKEKGVGDIVGDIAGKAIRGAAADSAADQALSFGKKLLG